MLSSREGYPPTTVAGLEASALADGLFHAATWLAVALGVWLLRRHADALRRQASGRILLGWMLAGWGLFNLAEGLVNHHLLGLHHVRERATAETASRDLAFLALGAALVVAGALLVGGRRRQRSV